MSDHMFFSLLLQWNRLFLSLSQWRTCQQKTYVRFAKTTTCSSPTNINTNSWFRKSTTHTPIIVIIHCTLLSALSLCACVSGSALRGGSVMITYKYNTTLRLRYFYILSTERRATLYIIWQACAAQRLRASETSIFKHSIRRERHMLSKIKCLTRACMY